MAATWNPSDKAATITLSGGNLTATLASGSEGNAKATSDCLITGPAKKYWEVTCGVVGSNGFGVGFTLTTGSTTEYLGRPADASFGYYNDTAFFFNDTSQGNGEAYDDGDVISVALDKGNNRVWFRKNGGDWNDDPSANPATNAGGIDISFASGDLLPVIRFENTSNSGTVNFGGSAFVRTPPSGFTGFVAGGTNYSLTAAAGAVAETGVAAGLSATRILPAAVGAAALMGVAAGLQVGRLVTPATGAFALSSQDATLTKSGINNYSLTASVGIFVLSGQAADLFLARTIVGAAYAFTLSGVETGLKAARLVGADADAFVFSGKAAALIKAAAPGYTLTAAPAQFTFDGRPVRFLTDASPWNAVAAASGSWNVQASSNSPWSPVLSATGSWT